MSTTYADKLEAFRKSDAERDALVAQILQDYEDLKLKVGEISDDYKNEVASRRMWQNKAASCERDLEQALSQQKQVASTSNFAVVLIDGDGAIFSDYLYGMGKDGGAEAAHQLHKEVQRHLKAIYPDSNVDDWNIVVQVVLNLSGLAAKL
ncbi:hypothetical protein CKM354_000239900 [Cercospora kikuchii]|uniref:DUF7923 domain-containing protein n=1 Tax=Cercospora kikuchii TaxID=84275 RepID=A0A9P3CCD0_9PEZI|nr:uncharacterized protein CKM354_000239900 [Cercospora kikuchii]GIZ39006.1 hypothetical protein CKM354_000239900 [Cercospora kikuchii]